MSWENQLPIDPVKKAVKVEGVAGGTPVPVTGSFSATTTAHATAAAPALVEGSDNQLSLDLSGNLRTLATATTAATATAADPAYAEGSTSAISQDRTGHLRVGLPPDAATQTTLALIKAKTDNLDVALSTRTKPADTQKVDGSAVTQPVSGTFWQATQPVSAASLPLPSGAATSAKQDTGNTSLSSIEGKVVLPAALDGSGFLKVHEQGTAAISAAALPLPSGAATSALQTTGNASLASIDTKLTAPLTVAGRATAAAPAYSEGTDNRLSQDLNGNLRVIQAGGTTYFPSVETPSGTVNGTTGSDGNATFTLAHTPTDTPAVYVDGLLQQSGVHYTISGVTITFLAPSIPVTGSWVQVRYTWSMASSTLNATLVVDASGNVQPTGDAAARSIHVTVDSAAALPLPSGAATAAGISSLIDTNQILQRLAYAQLAQQRAALCMQSAISGQAVFLPEMPAFLGVA